MQIDEGDSRLLEPVTGRIIGYAFRLANALAQEMRKSALTNVQQRGIVACYDDMIVGKYTSGLLVEDQLIVELKVVAALGDVHLPQRRNDVRATGKSLCLMIKFGPPTAEIRRITPSLACSVAQA